MKMEKQDRIAVLSDLEQEVKAIEMTPGRAQRAIDIITKNNYESICPDSTDYGPIEDRFALIVCGDSSYGARMGIIKEILVAALYSPEPFEKQLRQSSRLFDKKKIKAFGKYFANSAHRKIDYGRSELSKNEGRRIDLNNAYREMADVVSEIGREFGQKDAKEACELAEVGVHFSGKWNGTGRNLTFTNERVRDYSTKLQQLVNKIMFAGTEYASTQLTQAELFPVTHGI